MSITNIIFENQKCQVICTWPQARDFPGGLVVKNPPAMPETWVLSLGQEDSLEEEMATHSSILAWEIPWTEEPGRLYSPWYCERVEHDLAIKQRQRRYKLGRN